MARFSTSGLDDIIQEMQRMGQNVGPVAEEMCMAAVEEIRDAWKKSADDHGLRATGDMINSISFGPARSCITMSIRWAKTPKASGTRKKRSSCITERVPFREPTGLTMLTRNQKHLS